MRRRARAFALAVLAATATANLVVIAAAQVDAHAQADEQGDDGQGYQQGDGQGDGSLPTPEPGPNGLFSAVEGHTTREHANPTAAAWTQPVMPSKCTEQQKAAGSVAGCLLDGPSGLPEDRGWPTPPFPTQTEGDVLPWIDVAAGASGTNVTKIQQALNGLGSSIAVDGQYGPATESAVRSFQANRPLPVTGIVDQATADALGVQNRAAGPFPPPGWIWSGWGYNGSPAIADWSSQLVANAKAVGGAKAGSLRAFSDMLPLWEGFIGEISAAGYTFDDVGTYVFRCTSNSRKDCKGLTRNSLSNHSYGLALDMNTSANPELTYNGIDGASACATPVRTDIPKWVVDAAQRWGLYWGGYGWSGGCSSPAEQRTSILRDSMHFEFRGTPEQARAIAVRNSTGPKYCANVISGTGATMLQCTLGDTPAAGWRLPIATDAPKGATAALVNITLTGALAQGYATAETCGAMPGGDRAWSNGNAGPGQTTANLAVVPLDQQGRFCIYGSSSMQRIVDVQGFFLPPTAAGNDATLLQLSAPRRVADTRQQRYCTAAGACLNNGPVPAGSAIKVMDDAIPSDARAVLANLTVTGATAGGYLTADACATLAPGDQTRSNVNFAAGQTVANLAVVPVDRLDPGGSFCTYSSSAVQKIVDVQGVFAPVSPDGWAYTPSAAQRIADTRQCYTPPGGAKECGVKRAAGSITHVQGPKGVSAVLVNLTLTDAPNGGYATAGACSALQGGPQTTSNANFGALGPAANIAVVPVDTDGTFCIYTSATANVIVDLQGTFATSGALRFVPITPVRKQDTRTSSLPAP